MWSGPGSSWRLLVAVLERLGAFDEECVRRPAIRDRAVAVMFQPIVLLPKGTVVAYEALTGQLPFEGSSHP